MKTNEQDIGFDEWFDIFTDQALQTGYTGSIDKESFREDYDNGKSPEEAAKEFIKEINS